MSRLLAKKVFLVGIATLQLVACSSSPTQLVVTVDSDLTPSTQLRRVRIEVSEARTGGEPSVSAYEIGSASSAGTVTVPFSFTVVPRIGDSSRRALVKVIGELSDRSQVEQVIERGFISGQVLNASIFLASRCVDVVCLIGQTCDDGACIDLPATVVPDAGMDAGTDTGTDAERDALSDPLTDDVPPMGSLPPPTLRYPVNGFYTGSIHAPRGSTLSVGWAAVPGATGYRVELYPCRSVGCTVDGPHLLRVTTTGLESEVIVNGLSPEPPVGRRVLWRVRACERDLCGEASEARYANVGRLPDDFNGDGYSDVLVGAAEQGFHGEAYVVEGGADRGPLDAATFTSRGITTQRFGQDVSAGDFDGDGFADAVVIGGSRPDDRTVFMFRGGPRGPERSLQWPLEVDVFERQTLPVASVGDVNADGRDDFVVGAPAHDGGGQALLFLDFPAAPLPLSSRAHASFGANVSPLGDLDGDGLADFSVTSQDPQSAVHIFSGNSSRTPARTALLEQPDRVREALFGFAVAAGDFDGDQRTDLAISAPEGASEPIYVYLSGGRPLVLREPLEIPSSSPRAGGLGHGAYLQAVDVDGNGRDELASVDRDSAGGSRVETFTIVSGVGRSSFRKDGESITSIASADLDGDGAEEIVFSSSNDGEGEVTVIHDATGSSAVEVVRRDFAASAVD